MTATLDRPAAVDVDEPWRDRLRPLVGPGGWTLTLAVTLLAGLLRFVRLDQPASTLGSPLNRGEIFDEVYYACDAQNLLRYGAERSSESGAAFCTPGDSASFVVHPPLGKWLIALGEQLFGFNTWGWRFMAAVFGTLTVLLVVRIGRRMTGSTLLGALAGLLLTVDGLHFVQSRTAMVDVFLVFFVVAAFGALVLDRDDVRRRLADLPAGAAAGGLGHRWWRWVAGVSFGAALACKWSALFPLAVLGLLTVVWEVGARRTAGEVAPWRTTLRRSALPVLGLLVVLPVAVYLASWTGWFLSDGGYDRHWADGRGSVLPFVPDALRSLWHYHHEIYDFHASLTSRHGYQSHPLSWPFLGRPVSYYYPPGIGPGEYGCTAASCSREVLAIGTPALWWAMVPAWLLLTARWLGKRDWRAGALLAMSLVSILAWIPSDLDSRTMFLFYALPSIPFLCLGMALLAGWVLGEPGAPRRKWAAGGVAAYTGLVVANFVYLYPVLAAWTLSYGSWYDRMWFRSWI